MNFLIPRKLAIGKGKYLLGSSIKARTYDYKAFGELSGLFIWNANDGRIHHSRMLHQQRLKFGRSNTKAIVFDHLFLAINDVGIAILIEMTNVTSIKPAITQGLCGGLGCFPIALHNLGATNN